MTLPDEEIRRICIKARDAENRRSFANARVECKKCGHVEIGPDRFTESHLSYHRCPKCKGRKFQFTLPEAKP